MGEKKKFCICCACIPVRNCCCGCSLLCACITLAILQILGGLLTIIVASAEIHAYKYVTYSEESSYFDDDLMIKLRKKYIAIFSLEIVYGVVLLTSGIIGTMSQKSALNAKLFYYAYFTFVVVYSLVLIIIIIIYGSMLSVVEDGVIYYSTKTETINIFLKKLKVKLNKGISITFSFISYIINLIITLIIDTYLLLVVWSNWQQKESFTGRNNNPQYQNIIVIQQQNIPMQNYAYVQPHNNYQPQVQMYQPQVQMYPVGQPQIQEAAVNQHNNDYSQVQQQQPQNNNFNQDQNVKNYQQDTKYQ